MNLSIDINQSIIGVGLRRIKFGSGLVDTLHTLALEYMQVVPLRDAATLLPIVQAHTLPGTIVHSDEWAAYRRVASLPNVAHHDTVNHSVEFVNSTTGTHTQIIESYWNKTKIKFKWMKGCNASMLPSYLDKFMWRERFGKTANEAFNIARDIADQYPV